MLMDKYSKKLPDRNVQYRVQENIPLPAQERETLNFKYLFKFKSLLNLSKNKYVTP